MDKFVLLSDKDKRAYFEVAAAGLNVMPQLIEKGFSGFAGCSRSFFHYQHPEAI